MAPEGIIGRVAVTGWPRDADRVVPPCLLPCCCRQSVSCSPRRQFVVPGGVTVFCVARSRPRVGVQRACRRGYRLQLYCSGVSVWTFLTKAVVTVYRLTCGAGGRTGPKATLRHPSGQLSTFQRRASIQAPAVRTVYRANYMYNTSSSPTPCTYSGRAQVHSARSKVQAARTSSSLTTQLSSSPPAHEQSSTTARSTSSCSACDTHTYMSCRCPCLCQDHVASNLRESTRITHVHPWLRKAEAKVSSAAHCNLYVGRTWHASTHPSTPAGTAGRPV